MNPELLEKHRYINVDHHWWDHIYEDTIQDMRDIHHVEISNLHFSGFWSQGDGAGFNYKIRGENVEPFLRTSGLADHFPMMLKLAADPQGSLLSISSYRPSGRYSHSNTVYAEIERELWEDNCDQHCAMTLGVMRINDAAAEAEMEEFEKAVNEHMRGLMDQLYERLGEEYEHLTSDEAVSDAILANDLLEEEEEVE